MIGVGAAFDIHTGRIKDSPLWMKTRPAVASPPISGTKASLEALSGEQSSFHYEDRYAVDWCHALPIVVNKVLLRIRVVSRVNLRL